MEKKLKTLLTYSHNASWFTLRHVLVVDYIFNRCNESEVIYSRDLISHLGLYQSTVNRILGSLSDFGTRQYSLRWVAYEMSKQDRRQREISLTPLGKAVQQHYLEF